MSFPIDQARPVREGEQLDIATTQRLSGRLTSRAQLSPFPSNSSSTATRI